MYRVLLPDPSPLLLAISHSEPRAAWLKRCAHAWPIPGIGKSGMSRGSVGQRAGMLQPPHLSLVPLFPQKGLGCKWDHPTFILSSNCHPTRRGGIAQGESWALSPGATQQGPRGHAAVMSFTGYGEFTSLCVEYKDTRQRATYCPSGDNGGISNPTQIHIWVNCLVMSAFVLWSSCSLIRL